MQRLLFFSMALLWSGLAAAAPGVLEVQRLEVLPAYEMRAPAVAWDGTHYLLVFEAFPESQPDRADLYLARITASGELVGGDVTALGLGGALVPSRPSIAHHAASGRTLIAWQAKSGPFSDVAMAFMEADGTVGPIQALTMGDDAELPPRVGAADAGFLVVWAAATLDGPRIVLGQRFAADKTAIDADPERLSNSTFSENRPALYPAGDRFYVTWDEADDIDVDGFVSTVRMSGPFRFQAPARIAQGEGRQSGLTIAPLGDRFYAIWQDFGRQVPDVWGAVVQDSLQIAVGPNIVAQADGNSNEPRVLPDPDGALVIWQRLREGRTRGTIRAGRIGLDGRVVEAAGFEVIGVEENVFEIGAAKGDTDQYLVAAIEDLPIKRLVFTLVTSDFASVPAPEPDAGPRPDTGNPRRDSGVVQPADAGVLADASVSPGPSAPRDRDSGCQSAPTAGGLGWLLPGLLLARLRRRRSR